MNKKYAAITFGIMCFLLTLGIIIQINTIKDATKTLGIGNTKNELRDEVLKWKEKYDTTYSTLIREEEDLEKTRASATKNDENSTILEEKIKESSKLLGLTDVSGSGIIITIADSKPEQTQNQLLGIVDTKFLLVHSTDLIKIVNELKNAGAEAISINDERIVLNTAITCDGNVILVNGEKIGSPFVIKAIGNSASLSGALIRPGGYLELMKKDGIQVDLKKSDNISIKKYNGVLKDKHLIKSK